MPRVSVVVVHYNTPQFLPRAMQSVESQTYRDFETILIDDGSTHPDVPAILDSAPSSWRVHRCDTTTADRAASVRYATLLNWAVNGHSTGEYVTWLMGDDWMAADRLDRMVTTLDSIAGSVCYGSQELHDELGVGFHVREANVILTDAFERVDLNSVMMTRKAFQQVGGFETAPHFYRNADAHTWAKLTDAGHLFHPVPGPPTDHKTFRSGCITDNVLKNREPWDGSASEPMVGKPPWVP